MNIDFFSDINRGKEKALEYEKVDRFMVAFAWWSTVILSVYSLVIYFAAPAENYPNPFSWRVVEFTEILAVMLISFITAGLLSFLNGRIKNHYLWRFIATNLLFVYPYLIIFISGGSIEWHFHFFITFALLVLWADWRLGWWAIVTVALHHSILNFVAPYWVYFYGRNDIAFLAHALLVLMMAIITTLLSEKIRMLVK